MSIYVFCILLIVIVLICKYKNIRIEYMSIIYNVLLIFLIYIFAADYKTTTGFLLTVLFCIFSIISLCNLEYRNIRISSKENIPLIFMTITMILEEVFFRKVLFYHFDNNIDYLILGSIVFGAVHVYFSKKDIFFKFILGLLLSLIYIRTEDLYVTLFLHLLYNLFILKLKGVKQYDKN
ncbi:CPBP family intramembrane glutamic endopeptidase [Mammaliicoccus lentus]|uniref:CPBP family intramembrane glutamic endopeptidase n=1 Tax=Mammaliicoccus lentus TaxID=42858 RepID=UPI001B3265BE|nr:CPBP family intramembrane glutamic endopeptidase [Mammaliicoccus lentus]